MATIGGGLKGQEPVSLPESIQPAESIKTADQGTETTTSHVALLVLHEQGSPHLPTVQLTGPQAPLQSPVHETLSQGLSWSPTPSKTPPLPDFDNLPPPDALLLKRPNSDPQKAPASQASSAPPPPSFPAPPPPTTPSSQASSTPPLPTTAAPPPPPTSPAPPPPLDSEHQTFNPTASSKTTSSASPQQQEIQTSLLMSSLIGIKTFLQRGPEKTKGSTIKTISAGVARLKTACQSISKKIQEISTGILGLVKSLKSASSQEFTISTPSIKRAATLTAPAATLTAPTASPTAPATTAAPATSGPAASPSSPIAFEPLQAEGTPILNARIASQRPIAEQRAAHTAAKQTIAARYEAIGAKASFISPSKYKDAEKDVAKVKIDSKELINVTWCETQGSSQDIQAAGQQVGKMVYVAATQANAGNNANSEYQAPLGRAAQALAVDRTQGPDCVLAYEQKIGEAQNAGACAGFNSFAEVLSDGTEVLPDGTKDVSGDTRSVQRNGYITPGEKTVDAFVRQLKERGQKTEFLLTTANPLQLSPEQSQLRRRELAKGNVSQTLEQTKCTHSVHLLSVTAAALSTNKEGGLVETDGSAVAATLNPEQKKEVAYLTALSSYMAVFEAAIQTYDEDPNGGPVYVKIPVLGSGAFQNDPESVAKAFYEAASLYKEEISAKDIHVEITAFNPGTSGTLTVKELQANPRSKRTGDAIAFLGLQKTSSF